MRAVTLVAGNIDIHGRPYSDAIFGNAPRYYSDTNWSAYKNDIDDNPGSLPQMSSTMLYLSPENFDVKEFEAYAGFLKTNGRRCWLLLIPVSIHTSGITLQV